MVASFHSLVVSGFQGFVQGTGFGVWGRDFGCLGVQGLGFRISGWEIEVEGFEVRSQWWGGGFRG